jgi:predicted solute-binding protein
MVYVRNIYCLVSVKEVRLQIWWNNYTSLPPPFGGYVAHRLVAADVISIYCFWFYVAKETVCVC